MPEGDTRVLDVPSEETGRVPVSYTRVEAHYFGLAPHLLVLALGGLAVGAAVALLAGGHLIVGAALAAAGLLAVLLFLEQARRRRESALDVICADGVDRLRAVSGVAAASVSSWSRAGREVARVRLETRRLLRERGRLQHELGGVVYRGEDHEPVLAQLRELDERLAACAERARRVVEEAHSRVRGERLAGARTEIVRPD